jgi:hypothetical protein
MSADHIEASARVSTPPRMRFADLAANALRYWEPRRLLYNAALLAVVAFHYMSRWPASKASMTGDALLGMFFLAVLANVAYCAAYPVDLFVQFSGQRDAWIKWRWVVLVVGICFAAIITHFIVRDGILSR